MAAQPAAPGTTAPETQPATDSRVPESCDDGVQNGPESDIDCGGDCPPCERKDRCHHANDCWSGLCADGVCRERRLDPGAPVPLGYDTQLARSDAAASVRLVGSIFLGVGYGSAYFAALSYPGGVGALYVPVLGPWVSIKQGETPAAKALLAANGAVQGTGAILLIGGILGAGTQLVRKEPREEDQEEARIRVLPAVGSQRLGLFVHGRF